VLKASYLISEFAQVVEAHSEPTHARIHLDVQICYNTGLFRGSTKSLNLVKPIYNWNQPLLNTCSSLTFPETGQTKYWLGNSTIAEFDSLLGQSHAKPFSTFRYQPLATSDGAVTVSISFNHRQYCDLGSYPLANKAKVCG
jgi:hypothetical protein